MRRFPFLILMLWAVALAPTWAEAGSEESAMNASQRFRALNEEFESARDAHHEASFAALEAAAEAGEPEPEVDWSAPARTILPRFRSAADEYAGTDDAAPYLVWIVQNLFGEDESAGALATLADAHAASAALEPLAERLPYLAQAYDAEVAARFVAAVSERNESGKLRAWATYAHHLPLLEAGPSSEHYARAKAVLEALIETEDGRPLAREVRQKIAVSETFALGMVAPDIEGLDLEGVPFKLSDYAGKVVFLDFWGDW